MCIPPAHSLQGTGLLNGRSEGLLGKFTSEYPGSRGSQASICIATKLAPYPWRVTAKQFVAACRWALLFGSPGGCVAWQPVASLLMACLWEPPVPSHFQACVASQMGCVSEAMNPP